MRYLIPSLCLASPALAHPAGLPHTHSATWVVPVALLLIGAAAVVAARKSLRQRGQE